MPRDYSNPSVIRFLKESYDKESEDRIAWFMRNKENIIASTTLNNKHKDYHTEDIARAYLEPLMPNLASHHKVTMSNRLRKAPLDNLNLSSSQATQKISSDEKIKAPEVYSGALMMPVGPDVAKILKEELPYGGRQQYLNKRNKVIPEEKYYFCETSGSMYGWGLKNSKTCYPISDCKRKAIFFQDLISRSGPHPDPPHYNEIKKYSKCIS